MTPTMELRWLEREIHQQLSKVPDKWEKRNLRILQQKWVVEELNSMTGQYTLMQEWRDVPVVKEGEA